MGSYCEVKVVCWISRPRVRFCVPDLGASLFMPSDCFVVLLFIASASDWPDSSSITLFIALDHLNRFLA